RQDIWRRRFLSRGYNLLARTLLGTRVRDIDCALKVFRREVLPDLLPQSRGFFVNTEMLCRARQHGHEIAVVGVRHPPRFSGTSKVSLSDVPRTLRTLLPFWWSEVLFPGTPTLASGGRESPGSGSFAWARDGGLWLVLLIAAVLFFGRLRTPLQEPQEPR